MTLPAAVCPDCGTERGAAAADPCACGSLRTPVAQVVRPDIVSVTASHGIPSVRSRTHLYMQWASIAGAHAAEAHEALAKAMRVAQGGTGVDQLLNRECEAALISVCASAFAIEALHGALLDVVPIPDALRAAWRDQGTTRHRRIIETLKLGFRLGPLTRVLTTELKWLFETRGNAVHFREQMRDVVPHPTGVHVAAEQGVFSAEASRRATRLVVSVLRVVSIKPKPVGNVVGWATSHGLQLTELANKLDTALPKSG